MNRTLFVLSAAALSTPAYAATTCNSLYAALMAERQDLDDCHADTFGIDVHGCEDFETANQCASRLYNNPGDIPVTLDGGEMIGKWLPECLDGTSTSCASPELACLDGTRPAVYVDKAVDDSGTPIESNDWIIYMGGEGGPCTGEGCWVQYRNHAVTDNWPFQKAMSSYHPDFGDVEGDVAAHGLMSDESSRYDATLNMTFYNDFHTFNRIRFERCSDSASDVTDPVSFTLNLGQANATSATVDVYHHGDRIWEALLNYLTTTDGRDLEGTLELPSFADAEMVVMAGSSDASKWLVLNADNIAGKIRDVAADTTEVRLIVDGYFGPMLENEARYNDAVTYPTLYDGPFSNPGPWVLPASTTVVGTLDYGTDFADDAEDSYTDRGLLIDADCLAAHPTGLECYDTQHVLAEHLDTPYFVLADQRDPVVRAQSRMFATDPDYRWDVDEWRTRVQDQGRDLVDLYATDSEEAPGTWAPSVFLTRPNSPQHVHLGDNDEFFEKTMRKCDGTTELESWTITEALYAWALDPVGDSIDAIEVPGTGAGVHWVTNATACGSPQ